MQLTNGDTDANGKPLTQNQILKRITQALQDNRGQTEKHLTDLERKIDQLSRDIQNQFVTKLEYDPRHKYLEDKMEVFERHMLNSEIESRVFAVTQLEVKQLTEDVKELDIRQRGAAARAIPWITVSISLIALITAILQHVQLR